MRKAIYCFLLFLSISCASVRGAVMITTKTSSAIDYPREDLSKDVWEVKDSTVKLHNALKEQILFTVENYMDGMDIDYEALKGIYIYGSILTNQYTSNSDIDCQIVFDKDYASKHFPGFTGEDLYDAARGMLHGVKLDGTEHPLNCTVAIEGEIPLGKTPYDPVYDVLEEKILNDPVMEKDDFDPDERFVEEKEDAKDIAAIIDKMIYDTKEDVIDFSVIEESIGEVKNPDKLIQRLEEKLEEIENDIVGLVEVYTELKDARTEALSDDAKNDWEESKHYMPENVIFKYLERYNYIDTLRALKRKYKEGLDETTVEDLESILHVARAMLEEYK